MAARYEVRESDDGQWYFVLLAANGEIVATSELYTRAEDAQRGIEAAIRAMLEAIDTLVTNSEEA